jgi:hypothetical protein
MDMKRLIEIVEAKGTSMPKIDRSAFLYLDPDPNIKDFAQCGSCFMFMPGKQRCSIFGKNDKVIANASCGLYVYGKPYDDQLIRDAVTPKEAGYVEHKVRCENCSWFNKPNKCGLFESLNDKMSDVFKLDEKVEARACCNGWQSKK